MSIIIGEGIGFKAPDGTHIAVCFGAWYLGLQKTSYQGKDDVKAQVVIGWEIDERIPEGEFADKRFRIYKTYTASLNEKSSLRKHLESWRGKKFAPTERKAFDLETLIGVPCMLTIIRNENDNPKVESVTNLPKGVAGIEPENTTEAPKWETEKIAQAVDSIPKKEPGEVADEEIPF